MSGVLTMRKLLQLSASSMAASATLLAAPAAAQSSPSPYTSAVRYDIAGLPTGTIAPDPDGAGPLAYAATRTTYDASGRPVTQETGELSAWQSEAVAPAAWTGFTILSTVETTFDVMDRKIKTVVKGSDSVIVSVTQYSYDVMGRLECTALRMNPAVYGSLPVSACSLGTEGANGKDRITKNVYNPSSHLIKIQKAFGTPLQQDYATYTYTPNGKQATVKDANSTLAGMTYDGHDRQIRWNFPSKTSADAISTTDYEEYGYDANGNRTSLRKRDGSTITYQYDALNRNIVKVVPERSGLSSTHTRDVYYGYDLRGLQTYARFDSTSGEGIANAYDGFGRLSSSTQVMDGQTRTLTFQHDQNGNRTNLGFALGYGYTYTYDGLNRLNGLYAGTGLGVWLAGWTHNQRGSASQMTSRYSAVTTYGYDNAARLTGLAHVTGPPVAHVSYAFGYNPASQINSRSMSNDAYVWPDGQVAGRTYAVNGLNQYTSAGAVSFGYDDNGNLTSSGATSYTYDIENRLVSASGATSASLRYDPLGRLYETGGGAAGITRFLYDGDELIAEFNGSGSILRQYGHGKGNDDPVYLLDYTNCCSFFLHANHQGSIVSITGDSTTAATINTYDEWGIPGQANAGRFQYTGQAWIAELGMYYYKARIYSPTLGRFLQTDPIGYDDQVNLYAYVGNDPVNMSDPSGKCGYAGAATAAVGAAAIDGPIPIGDVVGLAICGVGIIVAVVSGPDDSVPASDRQVQRSDNGGPRMDEPRPPNEPKVKVVAPPSPNQLNQQILKGNAPRGIERVDIGKVRGEQDHVHVNGGALNKNGTWKHEPDSSLTKRQEEWLKRNGFTLPK